MRHLLDHNDFWKTKEGIKVLYWYDAFYKFRFAKNCIKKGFYWGWEELHQFFLYRKKFHESLNKFK